MLSTFVYFIRSQFTQRNQRINETPVILPFAILVLVAVYFIIHYSKYYLLRNNPNIISVIVFIIILQILFIILLSTFYALRRAFEGDIMCFAHHDTYNSKDAGKYKDIWRYFAEINAYKLCNKFSPMVCAICADNFYWYNHSNRRHKRLIFCGHLFHSSCLTKNENIKWNDKDLKWALSFPWSECSVCRTVYNSVLDTSVYNELIHDEKIWHWLQGYPRTANAVSFVLNASWNIINNIWEKLNKKYVDNRRKTHPRTFIRKCIIG